MLSDLQNARKITGTRQVIRALKNGIVLRVYLAEDADPRVTEPVEILCKERGVACESVPTMSALGAVCGIAVGSAVAAILA